MRRRGRLGGLVRENLISHRNLASICPCSLSPCSFLSMDAEDPISSPGSGTRTGRMALGNQSQDHFQGRARQLTPSATGRANSCAARQAATGSPQVEDRAPSFRWARCFISMEPQWPCCAQKPQFSTALARCRAPVLSAASANRCRSRRLSRVIAAQSATV